VLLRVFFSFWLFWSGGWIRKIRRRRRTETETEEGREGGQRSISVRVQWSGPVVRLVRFRDMSERLGTEQNITERLRRRIDEEGGRKGTSRWDLNGRGWAGSAMPFPLMAWFDLI
jgi:hypothetical protein